MMQWDEAREEKEDDFRREIAEQEIERQDIEDLIDERQALLRMLNGGQLPHSSYDRVNARVGEINEALCDHGVMNDND